MPQKVKEGIPGSTRGICCQSAGNSTFGTEKLSIFGLRGYHSGGSFPSGLYGSLLSIRYASRLAKNVAHSPARGCGPFVLMKKTALLIDGGWFCKGLGKLLDLPNGWPSAAQVIQNARAVLQADEELFRIFYYDCEPYDREVTNPVDRSKTDYATSPAHKARKQFFFDLSQTEFVALRRGELKARGWEFSKAYQKSLMTGTPVAPTAADLYPKFEQKGVDMRIGIDVATLSFKGIVDRIVLFSGDTDMIPALKLARREGLQVYVVKLGTWPLKQNLIEDSDGFRAVTPFA